LEQTANLRLWNSGQDFCHWGFSTPICQAREDVKRVGRKVSKEEEENEQKERRRKIIQVWKIIQSEMPQGTI
jgi:hypothetical protein